MKRYIKSATIGTGVISLVLLSGWANAEAIDQTAEWQEAAMNYEAAARVLHQSAQLARQQANQMASSTYKTPGQKEKNAARIANLKRQNAELLIKASQHEDHAARTWRRAAQSVNSELPSFDFFLSASDKARLRATTNLRQAAVLCEQAALIWAEIGNAHHQADTLHRAAQVREMIAQR